MEENTTKILHEPMYGNIKMLIAYCVAQVSCSAMSSAYLLEMISRNLSMSLRNSVTLSTLYLRDCRVSPTGWFSSVFIALAEMTIHIKCYIT